MGDSNCIGRIGALAFALGVGNIRRNATRMSVSIGAALVVMATVAPVSLASSVPCTDTHVTCALILGGTTAPTPDDTYVEIVKNHYIAPTHPGQDIDYVAVTTPEESWPITGILRLVGAAFGDPRVFGPGSPAWPDESWWKLSGLFDLTLDRSIEAGVADLEAAITEHPNERRVIYGLSQGAVVANIVKKKLAAQYPTGTTAPDIDFVLQGDENLPNGGLLSRFPGLYIPVLEWSFNGAAPTDTQFDTVEISRQYDGFTDFPLYPLNVIADLNAVLGILYLHTNSFDVSLPADPTKSAAYQGTHGDTDYYLFQTPDLPLFAPLRMLGVPEALIDVVEPFFRLLVELGYDRSIPPWEPTPVRLIPPLNPVPVATDLVAAIGEGINNVLALPGSPPLSIPASVNLAEPTTETAKIDISQQETSTVRLTQTEQAMSTGAAIDTRQMSTDTTTSTEEVTETDKSNEASAAASAPDLSASASTSEPARPAGHPAKRRPVVRDSLGTTAETTAADSATTASSSAGSSSADGNSSAGDAGGLN
jgi:hypothetical protein